MTTQPARRLANLFLALLFSTGLAACSAGGFGMSGISRKEPDSPFAPGVDLRAKAENSAQVGHRLVAAGEHELAIRAFNRAALDNGMNAEILSGLGTANLGLGRLGQAEELLRRALKDDPEQPEIWNNLGVVLMESGKNAQAMQIFRKAFALSNGQSDAIRDNLRVALAKIENSDITESNEDSYKLVRRGTSDYLIRKAE